MPAHAMDTLNGKFSGLWEVCKANTSQEWVRNRKR